MNKTNFDRFLEEQLQDPDFAARFKRASEAWDIALQRASEWSVNEKLAYLGGLLDGEGYIGIAKRMPTKKNRNATPKYTARISVSMCCREPLDFMAEVCGIDATKYRLKSRVRKEKNRRAVYAIDIENDDAVRVALLLQRFTILKWRQLEMIIELRGIQSRSKLSRSQPFKQGVFKSGNAKGHAYRIHRRSDDYLAQCEELYQACKKLNPRGLK